MATKKNKILFINEFAKLAGVYPDTVRNYQEKGLLPDRRNPLNNYRIFTMRDLEKLKKLLAGGTVYYRHRGKVVK
jgi:DNA-binding transcriptional MerR regulator